ncbi:unnamed protein product [Ranitomeya imitator]|uniref:Uncharacterized protein n=1 Tax=Ranitomeya imitator TaxID=111125 RepID=A0ABN9LFH8_9NEOB|nr:unnamed protein product [Ranitomeya imitator]
MCSSLTDLRAFADMVTVDPILVLVSFVVILFLVNAFQNQKKSMNFPPGPVPLPIIGNMHVINHQNPKSPSQSVRGVPEVRSPLSQIGDLRERGRLTRPLLTTLR